MPIRWVPRWLRSWRRPQLALVVLILAVVIGYAINARHHPGSSSSASTSSPRASASAAASGSVALSALPPEAAQTIRLIKAGGPFPYSQDGVVFGNNEHLLPSHASGYYHEYTVPTPGASDRATRRIVAGQGGEYFYTGDHYASFRRIDLSG